MTVIINQWSDLSLCSGEHTLESQRSRRCQERLSRTAWSSSWAVMQSTRKWLQTVCWEPQILAQEELPVDHCLHSHQIQTSPTKKKKPTVRWYSYHLALSKAKIKKKPCNISVHLVSLYKAPHTRQKLFKPWIIDTAVPIKQLLFMGKGNFKIENTHFSVSAHNLLSHVHNSYSMKRLLSHIIWYLY